MIDLIPLFRFLESNYQAQHLLYYYNRSFSSFIDNITFGVLEFKQFFKNLVVVECKGEDKISPINTLQYKNYPEEKKADFIKTLEEWNDFSEVNNIDKTMTAKKEMAPNQQFVVYSKIMEKAGNKTYYFAAFLLCKIFKEALKL